MVENRLLELVILLVVIGIPVVAVLTVVLLVRKGKARSAATRPPGQWQPPQG